MFYFEYKMKIGNLLVFSKNGKLLAVSWEKSKNKLKNINLSDFNRIDNIKECPIIGKTVNQLEEYFFRKRKNFNLDINIDELNATDFQKEVWHCLNKIPYGQTLSYSDIAKQVNREKAVRAVGSANGCNHFSIIIPCHRVVNKNNKLGGYAGGIDIKKKLLKLEDII